MNEDTAEYRKIQVLGRSSFAVTLPKPWVRERNMDSGSIVVLSVDKKGILHIIPERMHAEKEKPTEKILDMERISTPGALAEAIRACYKIGYETIKVRHQGGLSPGFMGEIHQAAESLYGTLIINETANETILKSSIDVRTFTVKSLISRMGSFFVYLSEEVERALQEGSLEDSETVEYRAKEVDKIYSLLVRQLVQGVRSQQVASRVGLQDVIQCLGSRMVAKALRDITMSMFMISKIVAPASKGSEKDVQTIIDLITELRGLYKKAYDSLLGEDIRKAAEVLSERESYHSKLVTFERSLPKIGDQGAVVPALVSLVWELQNVVRSVVILAEVAVNRYVEKG